MPKDSVAPADDDVTSDPSTGLYPPPTPSGIVRWVWRLIRDIIGEYQRDGVGDQAASITFWTLLSIPAGTLAAVSTLSSLGEVVGQNVAQQVQDAVIDFISTTFANPEPLESTFRQLFNTPSTGVATAAGIFTLYSISGAFAAVIRALDRAYGVENGRPWWYLRMVAAVLGFLTLAAFSGLASSVALLPVNPGSSLTHYAIIFVVFLAMTAWVTVLFHVAPNQRSPWLFGVPGAVITTTGWMLAVQGFRLYVRFARDTNQVQSTVAGVLVFFSFLYALSVIMLVGAEVNDILEHRAQATTENKPIGARAEHWWSSIRHRFDKSRVSLTDGADD